MATKTPNDIMGLLGRRLNNEWHKFAAGADFPWEPRVTLGSIPAAAAARDLPRYARWTADWRAWAAQHDVELEIRTQRVSGTSQQFPFAVVIPDIDTAVRLLGAPWPGQLLRGAQRAHALREASETAADPHLRARAVRETAGWSTVDFDMLLRVVAYCASNDTTGLTPRQVPVEGVHAKWLNTSHSLVAALAGRDSLGLAPAHPSVVHFTYLDPSHLAAGGRRHDSHAVGDVANLPYPPTVVLICENKDTAVTFPSVLGGIAVQGNGSGAGALAATPWIASAPLVVYWGDIDTDGLEILSQFRARDIVHHSMLMDTAAFDHWQQFGTAYDKKARLIEPRSPRPDLHLTDSERDLYKMLLNPAHIGPRRIEQERIPLKSARMTLEALINRMRATQDKPFSSPEEPAP
ncbi:Wadjet anti-phage system protein JetD domain-containing protein [Oerskovia paurometabola]|uniref:Wadjet anti-phage system protein JetD domain-containing protein n=1 Tax=Oerskovia paurometabola TaxID=162170 RepID=UPI003814F091